MLSRSARRALTRDMSECWQAINTVLQMMAHASSQGIYGKGRRRKRPEHPNLALSNFDTGEVQLFETTDDLLRSLRE